MALARATDACNVKFGVLSLHLIRTQIQVTLKEIGVTSTSY